MFESHCSDWSFKFFQRNVKPFKNKNKWVALLLAASSFSSKIYTIFVYSFAMFIKILFTINSFLRNLIHHYIFYSLNKLRFFIYSKTSSDWRNFYLRQQNNLVVEILKQYLTCAFGSYIYWILNICANFCTASFKNCFTRSVKNWTVCVSSTQLNIKVQNFLIALIFIETWTRNSNIREIGLLTKYSFNEYILYRNF